MEIEKSRDSAYEEYETLLLERDQIEKEAGQIWTVYLQEFGQLISDVFEQKVESIKRKKMLAYYQRQVNHGASVDPEAMEAFIKKEMAGYYAELRRLIDDAKRSRKAKVSSAYEAKRAKELYRRIAKLIHPDINPETDRNEQLIDLWQRALIAYHANNVKELSEVEVLVRKMLNELGLGTERADIPDIAGRIDDLKEEIRTLTTTEPYIYKSLLDDDEAVEKKKKELQDELDSYVHYVRQLDEAIEDFVANGGVRVIWQMN